MILNLQQQIESAASVSNAHYRDALQVAAQIGVTDPQAAANFAASFVAAMQVAS